MQTFLKGTNMTINQRLFEVMATKNIKASDLAKELDINKSVISAWKNRGTNPPIEYTVQICKLLDISIEYLITGKDGETLSLEEQKLLEAYRSAPPGMQEAARKLLDVPELETGSSIYSDGEEAI